MSEVLARWNTLYLEANGRSYVGAPGVRDPDSECDAFDPGEPAGDCQTDGHYLCGECVRRERGCPLCRQTEARCECERCDRHGCWRPVVFHRVYPDSWRRPGLCIVHAEALASS